jgi:hypothetical protein
VGDLYLKIWKKKLNFQNGKMFYKRPLNAWENIRVFVLELWLGYKNVAPYTWQFCMWEFM